MDEGASVAGRVTHGFEIGDGDGDEVAVESENDAADEERVRAIGRVGFGNGAEVGRAD